MQKTIIPIKGMHCRSCEILIKERLQEIPGIKNVQVFYKKKEAQFYSSNIIARSIIEAAVSEAGYEVGVDDSKDWLSKNPKLYLELAISLLVLIILYLAAKRFGLFNINVGGRSNPGSLIVVLLVGLTAGISTCMALVGGLVLGISSRHAENHPEASSTQRFRPHLFFNLGRILSYALLGGMIGLVGKVFQVSGSLLGLLTIMVGIVMLILGLQLTELFPKLSNGSLTLPSGISKIFRIDRSTNQEYSHSNSMLIGALTFFLPCGFTQAMQLYAMSTGSFISGALIMGTFAIGTAPGLLGIGGLTSVLKGLWAKRFFRFAGLVVIALAVFNISNGYNLTGFKFTSAKPEKLKVDIQDPNVKLVNGVQEVYMTQTSGGYKPNKFTIKNNLPVKWIIDSKDSNSCSGSILMQAYGVRNVLKPGTNIIEFTPNKIGDIKFSCSMGMYTGKFTVVEGGVVHETK